VSGARRLLNQANRDNAELEAISEVASGDVVKDELTTLKMVSPVFHQFLDCVYQLLRQHPKRFEFNERFLRRLLYHLYSCQYGTFLYNSEKERRDARAAEKTSSVWDYFLSRKAEFTNPEYDPTIDDLVKGQERILFPDLKDIRWWYQLFGRTDDEMNRDLNNAALAENDRQVALSKVQNPRVTLSEDGTGANSAAPSPKPPSLTVSQSALAADESPHEALTPDNPRAGTLRRSVSAEGANAFAAIREGIAGLGFGKGMLGAISGRVDESSSSTAPAPARSDQELREMT
jgi:myotubularin-related protein 6/7/8